MKKMNSKYANEPIVFLRFNKTKASTVENAEHEISKWGMLDVAKKDDGLTYVILYNAFTKEKIAQINYDDSEEVIASKIDGEWKKAKR